MNLKESLLSFRLARQAKKSKEIRDELIKHFEEEYETSNCSHYSDTN